MVLRFGDCTISRLPGRGTVHGDSDAALQSGHTKLFFFPPVTLLDHVLAPASALLCIEPRLLGMVAGNGCAAQYRTCTIFFPLSKQLLRLHFNGEERGNRKLRKKERKKK